MGHRLAASLVELKAPPVLVVGDLMIDRYLWTEVDRVSPEAPVLVLRSADCEERFGGAANVAHAVTALGCPTRVAGLVGDDVAGRSLIEKLEFIGACCSTVLVDSGRETTVKERFMARAGGRHGQQVLRVDTETRRAICGRLEDQLAERLCDGIGQFGVVLVTDYGKGVCTPKLAQQLIAAGRAAGVPIVIDPCMATDREICRNAAAVTPNRVEAGRLCGSTIRTIDDALAAGRQIVHDLHLDAAVITLDRDGMVVVERDGTETTCRTQSRDVYDVTGAGDVVLAYLGVGLASALSFTAAAELANAAADIKVEKQGVAVVTLDELRRRLHGTSEKLVKESDLSSLRQARRRRQERVVFTNGCFDLLHVGHVRYLREAAKLGDILVVAINSDASVRRIKGSGRPVIGEHERAELLCALECVDYVLVFDEPTPHRLLHLLQPDVLVKGGDYAHDGVVGREVVEGYGGVVTTVGYFPGFSTTDILRGITNGGHKIGQATLCDG